MLYEILTTAGIGGRSHIFQLSIERLPVRLAVFTLRATHKHQQLARQQSPKPISPPYDCISKRKRIQFVYSLLYFVNSTRMISRRLTPAPCPPSLLSLSAGFRLVRARAHKRSLVTTWCENRLSSLERMYIEYSQ